MPEEKPPSVHKRIHLEAFKEMAWALVRGIRKQIAGRHALKENGRGISQKL